MAPLLLDTCAAIWVTEEQDISSGAAAALNEANTSRAPVYVSPITAWELGLLTSRERLRLLLPPERWFARLLQIPGVRLADMPPDLLIASSFLPGKPPRDPADRIIAATARDLGATLVTRDRALLAYGEQGHVRVIAC